MGRGAITVFLVAATLLLGAPSAVVATCKAQTGALTACVHSTNASQAASSLQIIVMMWLVMHMQLMVAMCHGQLGQQP
jgi:hypothetical protein